MCYLGVLIIMDWTVESVKIKTQKMINWKSMISKEEDIRDNESMGKDGIRN